MNPSPRIARPLDAPGVWHLILDFCSSDGSHGKWLPGVENGGRGRRREMFGVVGLSLRAACGTPRGGAFGLHQKRCAETRVGPATIPRLLLRCLSGDGPGCWASKLCGQRGHGRTGAGKALLRAEDKPLAEISPQARPWVRRNPLSSDRRSPMRRGRCRPGRCAWASSPGRCGSGRWRRPAGPGRRPSAARPRPGPGAR
jgi:hypothetical protein